MLIAFFLILFLYPVPWRIKKYVEAASMTACRPLMWLNSNSGTMNVSTRYPRHNRGYTPRWDSAAKGIQPEHLRDTRKKKIGKKRERKNESKEKGMERVRRPIHRKFYTLAFLRCILEFPHWSIQTSSFQEFHKYEKHLPKTGIACQEGGWQYYKVLQNVKRNIYQRTMERTNRWKILMQTAFSIQTLFFIFLDSWPNNLFLKCLNLTLIQLFYSLK